LDLSEARSRGKRVRLSEPRGNQTLAYTDPSSQSAYRYSIIRATRLQRAPLGRRNTQLKNVGLEVSILIWIVLGLFVIAVFALARWTATKTLQPERPAEFGSAVHDDDITVRPV